MHLHTPTFMILIFVFFALGAAINVWRHAASVVNSSLNGVETYAKYFTLNGAIQATKTFIALCFLLFWLYHQGETVSIVGLVFPGGLPPQWLQSIFVVTPATAGAFGLFFDVVEDLAIIYLKKIVPGLNKDVPPAS